MATKAQKIRQAFLILLLVALLAAWGVSYAQNVGLGRSLAKEAQSFVKENTPEGAESASTVRVTREYVLFGPAKGSVTLYVREKDPSGAMIVGGVLFEYEHDGQKWQFVSSGAADGKDAQEAGEKAIEKGLSIDKLVKL